MGYFDYWKDYQLGKSHGFNPWNPLGYFSLMGARHRAEEKARVEAQRAAAWSHRTLREDLNYFDPHSSHRLPGLFRPQWWIDHWPLSIGESLGERLEYTGWKGRFFAAAVSALALLGATYGNSAPWLEGHLIFTNPWAALGSGAIGGFFLPWLLGKTVLLSVRIIAYTVACGLVLGLIAAVAGIAYAVLNHST